MKQLNVYLAGGMGKFGKEEFDKANTWRVIAKQFLENNEYGVKAYVTNPNDYFSFSDDIEIKINETQSYKTDRWYRRTFISQKEN